MASKKTQIQKFREAARDLETDDNEKRFNEKLGKIARQKHQPKSLSNRGVSTAISPVIAVNN
jgi:hypothetical protein